VSKRKVLPVITFNNERYSQDAKGYWRTKDRKSPKLLHREVWRQSYGEIPKSHHIHHLDGDPSNNSIENLECIYSGDHSRLHKIGKGMAVKQVDSNIIFGSIAEAERSLGVSIGVLARAIRKGHKCKGFKWEYANESP
jgi:hypothetical protein